MATKNYMINDKWLDLDKQNIVELQSVDGELDSLKVNGSEVVTPSGKITITENGTDIDIAQYATADVNVEGGGGSSDFSTAEVYFIDNTRDGDKMYGSFCADNGDDSSIMPLVPIGEEKTLKVALYKGKAILYPKNGFISGTGDVTIVDQMEATVTGDCTITISDGE